MSTERFMLSFLPSSSDQERPTEYLKSVSSEATTWTTDPTRAIVFLSAALVPVTSVLLRFPLFEPLHEEATKSEINMRNNIVAWFKPHALPSEL